MVIGIGMDMIEIDRVKKACMNQEFLTRYYTEQEQLLIKIDKKKCADNFAVKEAVAKLFGTGFREISPIEIEVLRDELGKPYVNLYGKAKKLAEKLNIQTIHVTITNTKEFSSAFAVGEGSLN